jgi:2,3-dihydroxybenzoate-AMP ligase
VIPKPGATIGLDDVRAHLEAKRVARFKFPERVEVVDSFPLTAVGKVSRRDLRELIERKLRKPGAEG